MVLESGEILTRSRKKPIRFGRLRPVSVVGWEKFSEHWSLLMFLDLKGSAYKETGERAEQLPLVLGQGVSPREWRWNFPEQNYTGAVAPDGAIGMDD